MSSRSEPWLESYVVIEGGLGVPPYCGSGTPVVLWFVGGVSGGGARLEAGVGPLGGGAAAEGGARQVRPAAGQTPVPATRPSANQASQTKDKCCIHRCGLCCGT